MNIIVRADWDTDVHPAWQQTHPDVINLNQDIQRQLPADLEWQFAKLEGRDIGLLRLIGSVDLKKTFGSYQLDLISQRLKLDNRPVDPWNHIERINNLTEFFRAGNPSGPLILVAAEREGPYTFIDGNHRAVALHLCDRLIGQPVYCGFSTKIGSDFIPFLISGMA